jgi:hypothetical protein
MAPVFAALAGLISVIVAVRLRRERLPARAVIVSPRKSTSIARDGAVSSIQSAELTVPADDLMRLWNPTNLENLASTYWRFLTKVTLGIVRVKYGQDSRSVCLLVKPLTLLRFDAPEYELEDTRGKVTWKIRDGLLVARGGRGCGHLSLEVMIVEQQTSPGNAIIRIVVDVSNFYPSIAAGFSTPVYEATQSSVHVLVTHAFLRSLATLKLSESKIGKLAQPDDSGRFAPIESAPADSTESPN